MLCGKLVKALLLTLSPGRLRFIEIMINLKKDHHCRRKKKGCQTHKYSDITLQGKADSFPECVTEPSEQKSEAGQIHQIFL